MTVPSYQFLAFAAVVALAINLSGAPRWRQVVLLVANLAFVSTFTHDSAQLAPFAGLLALGFAAVKLLERWKSRLLFTVLLLAALLAFCCLKRYTFVPHGLLLPYVYLTVGMSYVFFRIMHLIIDAYQGSLPERVGPIAYVNFTLNFTALISGPIQFFRDYRRTESEHPPALTEAAVGTALERIVAGFFKVAIVSPMLWAIHDGCLGRVAVSPSPAQHAVYAALAFGAYPVYLYFNFSGYTDFVIGVARFLRLELPENFDRPFLAEGYIEFWGRWHMTLSNWLKTYVYSPLLITLMRRYPSRSAERYVGVVAYFVTFFLIGAWHGQTSMFLMFGVLQGVGVSANKLYQIVMMRRLGRAAYRALCANAVYAALSRGLTFTFYAFSLLWFWSAWSELGRLASLLGVLGTIAAFGLVLASATVILSGMAALDRVDFAFGGILRSRYARTAWSTAQLVITLSVTAVLSAPAPSIVYRAF